MPRPRIPDRRQRILAAARELALVRGWPATSVADIARTSGIGKGAVYLEFADKSAILDAVLLGAMRRATAHVRAGLLDLGGAGGEPVGLVAVYRLGVEALLADPLLTALQLGTESVLGSHVATVTDGRYGERHEWLADYVVALQGAGVIDPQLDAASLTRVLATFTIGVLQSPGILGGDADELRHTVTLFADLIGCAVATGGPVDAAAARDAHLELLDRLAAQLAALEDR